MRIEPLFGNVLHRQMFSGLALLLPSNFRGFWLLGVGVGVFPEGEEILIFTHRFGGVAGEGISAGRLEASERTKQEVLHDSGIIRELLKLGGGSITCPTAKYVSPVIYT